MNNTWRCGAVGAKVAGYPSVFSLFFSSQSARQGRGCAIFAHHTRDGVRSVTRREIAWRKVARLREGVSAHGGMTSSVRDMRAPY